ncbi:MAG: DNA polymerase/3'-5' exonuclease PolX [bacterium]|nr:DNA polymerase/3'-5' exonuclease PolX [bacterium]
MSYNFSNKEVADLFRNISAVYQIKNMNSFQIRAYDLAADSVEHTNSEIKDLWETAQLDDVPGLGKSLRGYLNELFSTGKVKHFEQVSKGVPPNLFEFLKIPGVGPKTALKIAEAKVEDINDLEEKIKKDKLVKEFSGKSLANLLRGVEEYKRKSDRILLPVAGEIAKGVIEHLKKHSSVKEAHTLGSLRRRLATVGDIDISVASNKPEEVVAHFAKTPGISHVVEAGDKTSTIALKNGIRVDLMVQPPELYGNLLQHFTGGKNHNIKVRSLALKKGYSVSDNGTKEVKTGELHKFTKEEEVYHLLGMDYPAPELREDQGEIEAALEHKLPKLVELQDIKGDLHSHSTWSDGREVIEIMAKKAKELGREYLVMSDHSYPNLLDFKKRIEEIEQVNSSVKGIRVISGLEVNINADMTLQVPDSILEMHEVILVSIHSAFRQSKEEMTERIITALEHPLVNILCHPTARMLLEREGIEAEWEIIFKKAQELGKIIEINAFPNRLDLPDNLVRLAKDSGVKFSIDTDAHHSSHLNLMEYGVSVARRGWCEKGDIINTLSLPEIKRILKRIK